MLVLTVGLNVIGGSKAPVWSIAASLMCMIFALGSCSGAHFNPAVTVAISFSGRGKISSADVGKYIGAQLWWRSCVHDLCIHGEGCSLPIAARCRTHLDFSLFGRDGFHFLAVLCCLVCCHCQWQSRART